MSCVLVSPRLSELQLVLFKAQCKCGFPVWEPGVPALWMKLLLLIDNSATEIHNVRLDPCRAPAHGPDLAILVLVSRDQELPLWCYLSLEGIGLATIHCQKTIWHWGLLNITTHWTDWFYFFSLYGITLQLLYPLGLRLVCSFLIFPLKISSISSIWTFSFHPL